MVAARAQPIGLHLLQVRLSRIIIRYMYEPYTLHESQASLQARLYKDHLNGRADWSSPPWGEDFKSPRAAPFSGIYAGNLCILHGIAGSAGELSAIRSTALQQRSLGYSRCAHDYKIRAWQVDLPLIPYDLITRDPENYRGSMLIAAAQLYAHVINYMSVFGRDAPQWSHDPSISFNDKYWSTGEPRPVRRGGELDYRNYTPDAHILEMSKEAAVITNNQLTYVCTTKLLKLIWGIFYNFESNLHAKVRHLMRLKRDADATQRDRDQTAADEFVLGDSP